MIVLMMIKMFSSYNDSDNGNKDGKDEYNNKDGEEVDVNHNGDVEENNYTADAATDADNEDNKIYGGDDNDGRIKQSTNVHTVHFF